MKKFIIKSSLFAVLVFMSYFTYLMFGSTTSGDLIRIGYLACSNKSYFDLFSKIIPHHINYSNFSDINNKKHYKFLSIGDSFSQQGIYGYQNYISDNKTNTLVHLNSYKESNPIEYLYKIINGDILDSINVDYIILQTVERSVVKRCINIDTISKVNYQETNKLDLQVIEKKQNAIKMNNGNSNYLFTDAVLKFPLYNLLYLFDDNAFVARTYRVKTTKRMFSVSNNNLLFFDDDINCLKVNSNKQNIEHVNIILNKLSEKLNNRNIKLIVLISPDKYDMYYNYINEKELYPEPLFFKYFASLQKDYIYIDANKLLKNRINSQKDIYQYGDTHWSPYASEIIAKKIIQKTEY